MLEALNLPPDWQGNLWHYRFQEWRHTYHHHVELEFNLITRGSGVYLLDNEKYQMRRGDLIWFYPTQNHVLVQESSDFEMWIGVFRPQALGELATDANHTPLRLDRASGEVCRRLPLKKMQQLQVLLEDVAAAKERAAHFNAGLGYAFLSAWQFFENASAIPIEDVHPAVEKAAQLLQRESDAVNLNQLARQTGLSPARLSRLFKQQTGITIVDFRNRQRLGKFLRLYGNGQRHTMLTAALAAGFGSYPQFHRVFKKNLGCSPRSRAWQHPAVAEESR
jgi:AraC-like DNA-binding protein